MRRRRHKRIKNCAYFPRHESAAAADSQPIISAVCRSIFLKRTARTDSIDRKSRHRRRLRHRFHRHYYRQHCAHHHCSCICSTWSVICSTALWWRGLLSQVIRLWVRATNCCLWYVFCSGAKWNGMTSDTLYNGVYFVPKQSWLLKLWYIQFSHKQNPITQTMYIANKNSAVERRHIRNSFRMIAFYVSSDIGYYLLHSFVSVTWITQHVQWHSFRQQARV